MGSRRRYFVRTTADIPCRDQRCHKPIQEFRSANACGRPRPGKNKLRGPVNLERLRIVGNSSKKQRGGGVGANHQEL